MESPTGFIIVWLAFLAFAIVNWALRGTRDRSRIEADVHGRGAKPVAIEREWFGRGSWGERNERLYVVTFQDAAGTRVGRCKTGFWSGVYWTGDAIPGALPHPAVSGELGRLRDENERLKRELAARR